MKKQSLFLTMLICIVIFATQYGCSKSSDGTGTPAGNNNTTVDCTGNNPGFGASVLPLVQTKCGISSDCHASGSTNSGGPFTTYAQISARASNIKTQVSSGAMPKTGSLTATEKATLICWVNNGAADN